MMGIIRIICMDRDGKNREVLARGIRNSVGLDFNPKDKTRWFAGKQVGGMGDNTPPGEVNRASKAGLHRSGCGADRPRPAAEEDARGPICIPDFSTRLNA
jgi:hypothetical protein